MICTEQVPVLVVPSVCVAFKIAIMVPAELNVAGRGDLQSEVKLISPCHSQLTVVKPVKVPPVTLGKKFTVSVALAIPGVFVRSPAAKQQTVSGATELAGGRVEGLPASFISFGKLRAPPELIVTTETT